MFQRIICNSILLFFRQQVLCLRFAHAGAVSRSFVIHYSFPRQISKSFLHTEVWLKSHPCWENGNKGFQKDEREYTRGEGRHEVTADEPASPTPRSYPAPGSKLWPSPPLAHWILSSPALSKLALQQLTPLIFLKIEVQLIYNIVLVSGVWTSLVAQLVKNLPAMQETWAGKIPWRKERLPTPVFRPGEFHGVYSPWGCKESDMTERLSLHVTSSLQVYSRVL